VAAGEPLAGVPRYRTDEWAFDFDVLAPQDYIDRTVAGGVTSLAIGTLQLEVAVETKMVLYVWGMHPHTQWDRASLPAPTARPGLVTVRTPKPLLPGCTVSLAPVGAWATVYDEATGWVRVTPRGHTASETLVIVASGTALGITEDRIDAVWIQPVFDG
jgi:acyl dehydratase